MDTQTILITGSDADVDAAMEAETALVVDRGSEEPEVLAEIGRFLPGFTSQHEFDGDGVCHVTMSYSARQQKKDYINEPYNCFRIVLDVQALIHPDGEIRVYEPTTESTTHVFLLATSEYWSRFDREASPERKSLFGPISFLDAAWELSGRINTSKKWWEFWK